MCWPPVAADIPERSMDTIRIIVQAYFEMFRDLQWKHPLVFAHGNVAEDALAFYPVHDSGYILPPCVLFGKSKKIPDIHIISFAHEAFIIRNLGVVSLCMA